VRAVVVSLLLLASVLPSAGAFARTPHAADRTPHPTDSEQAALEHQQFIREYGLGVQRLPMDGGKIYGWKINDKVTFGRFKGENDEFGFSFEVNKGQRVEFTTDGLRWRKALGGH